MTVTLRHGALNARAEAVARHQRHKMTEQERRLVEKYAANTSLRLSRVSGSSSVSSSLSSSSSSSWSQRSRKGRDRSQLLEPLDTATLGVTGRFSKSSENVRHTRRRENSKKDINSNDVINRRYQSHSPIKTVSKTNLNRGKPESRLQKEEPSKEKKSTLIARQHLQPKKSLSRTQKSISKSPSKPAPFPIKTVSKSKPIEKSRPVKFAPKVGLVQCKSCSRNFAEDRIQTHVSICKRTKSNRRKPFDASKARLGGTEAAQYQGKTSSSNKNKLGRGPAKSDWRKKREEFIRSVRAAREAGRFLARGGDPRDLPPPPASDTSDYIQCQYCQRRFAQNVAERHIPKCKNIQSNKSTNKKIRK